MLMLRRTNLLIENWTNFILIYGSSIDGTNVLTITNSLLNKNETEKKNWDFLFFSAIVPGWKSYMKTAIFIIIALFR